MTKKRQVSHPAVSRGVAAVLAMLATLLAAQAQAGDYEDIDLDPAADCTSAAPLTFGAKVGGVTSAQIPVADAGGNVFMSVNGPTCTAAGTNTFDCPAPSGKFHVTAPVPPADGTPQASAIAAVTFPGLALGDPEGNFNVTATAVDDPATPADESLKTCTQQYKFHVVGATATGGWGDPHLITFDGTKYDFQSAGEFTALRSDALELQTRQTAVPTATIPITNAYTGITHCVAIFSAVAARLGSSKVSFQPPFKGAVDDKHMQLRVNGELVTLGKSDIELLSGDGPRKTFDGRIKAVDGGGIEIVAADGAQIVVTPDFWTSQNLWYLHVNVFQSAAQAGTMGLISEGNWLPLLPDGSSLGPKPESEDERYEQLYEKFADAWRVTKDTSLFKYEDGTDTATFTLDEWPRNHPASCDIAGQTPAQPTTQAAAEQACAAVIDPAQKADCIFDVAITGNLGFGKSYEVMQSFKPQGAGWQTHVVFPSTSGSEPQTPPDWKDLLKQWWWLILLLLLLLLIILWRLLKKKSAP